MKRRNFLGSAAGLAAALPSKIAISQPAISQSAISQSARASMLRLVPVTALTVLDPVFSTSLVTTSHGWTVYDTLFGIDSNQINCWWIRRNRLLIGQDRACLNSLLNPGQIAATHTIPITQLIGNRLTQLELRGFR